ncbi:SMP-30/gluconolactonase/LRE family protein [Roseomonas sp. OT10]|uniref:SMP-30/gluconolactonase/LRE family protein n=1 Tax=Roseomonas cutis TaxID=2897332 RepID=UPI001E5BCE50|nr:SMP-30/gluconolactonase/LRE family protein [Roseomonas sp. OT10]UFN49810.1 SMP-30/gluconolactonase/LRE family protein [Roseomonas sp. OT10]
MRGFVVDPAAIRHVGRDLQRPECILAERDGTLWSADARGGVMRIAPDGTQRFVGQRTPAFAAAADDAERFTTGTLPNGLAFDRAGRFLIANFGTDRLELMERDGTSRVLHDSIDGMPIGKVNFVLRDRRDRVWLTVSTRRRNWMEAMRPGPGDGYVAMADGRGLRVVAEGFAFTNEIRFDAAEEWLYVAETTGRRITRLRIGDDGAVTGREVFGPSEIAPGFPDGIAFDAFGNLWIAQVMADRVLALTPEGELLTLLDDGDPAATAALEAAFRAGTATPADMLAAGGRLAPWFASITFAGPDLRTACIGSLRGTTIPCFPSPVAGLPMAHWR